MKIAIINGPNLNWLGKRETSIYGEKSLDDIKLKTESFFNLKELTLKWFQSNSEGEIIDFIQKSQKETGGLVINPGAYSHTSVAIRDALEAYPHYKVEVHLSNIYKRDNFRQSLLTAGAVDSIMCGLGNLAYSMAIDLILKKEAQK